MKTNQTSCPRHGDRQKFALGAYPSLTGYSYTNMWWVTHNEHGAFEARGIHGQPIEFEYVRFH